MTVKDDIVEMESPPDRPPYERTASDTIIVDAMPLATAVEPVVHDFYTTMPDGSVQHRKEEILPNGTKQVVELTYPAGSQEAMKHSSNYPQTASVLPGSIQPPAAYSTSYPSATATYVPGSIQPPSTQSQQPYSNAQQQATVTTATTQSQFPGPNNNNNNNNNARRCLIGSAAVCCCCCVCLIIIIIIGAIGSSLDDEDDMDDIDDSIWNNTNTMDWDDPFWNDTFSDLFFEDSGGR